MTSVQDLPFRIGKGDRRSAGCVRRASSCGPLGALPGTPSVAHLANRRGGWSLAATGVERKQRRMPAASRSSRAWQSDLRSRLDAALLVDVRAVLAWDDQQQPARSPAGCCSACDCQHVGVTGGALPPCCKTATWARGEPPLTYPVVGLSSAAMETPRGGPWGCWIQGCARAPGLTRSTTRVGSRSATRCLMG